MATKIGELLVSIRADSKKLNTELKKAEGDVKNFTKKLESASKSMTSAGLKMSLAVTAPLTLIGKKAVTSAMEVVESENLFKVAMKDMAGEARQFSEEFARTLGLNQYAVREQIGTFNTMFNSMEIGQQKSYELSKGLTELAYDLASFRNLDVEDAFLKLQAGITGETEPLKRLGIILNETTIQQYAWRNGIAETGEKLTEQQKILARYGSLMEQTADAQGDMARTLDSPANKMRVFKEQINLMMIELGQGLIPVVLSFIDKVKPLVEKFTGLDDSGKKWVVTLGLIAAGAGPALLFFGNMTKAVLTLRSAYIKLNTVAKGSLGTISGLVAAYAAIGFTIDGFADKIENNYSRALVKGINAISATHEAIDTWNTATKVAEEYNISLFRVMFMGRERVYEMAEAFDKLKKEIEESADKFVKMHSDTLPNASAAMSNLISKYDEGELSLEAFTIGVEELRKETKNGHEDIEEFNFTVSDLNDMTELSKHKLREMAEAQREAEGATKDNTDAIEDQTKSVDELLESMYELYNLNQSVTEATWDYEDALKELEELKKKGITSGREYEEVLFKVQDEREDLTKAIMNELEAEDLSIERQKELKEQLLEVSLASVEAGETSVESFIGMANQFGISKDEIMGYVNELVDKYGELPEEIKTVAKFVDSEAYENIDSYMGFLNSVPRKIVTTAEFTGSGYYSGFSGNRQSGGEMGKTEIIPDLGIVGIKGEGILTREIMNAIKTGREDYLGVSGKGSGRVINNSFHFNISGNSIRDDSDIDTLTEKISRKLHSMSETRKRLGNQWGY